MRARKRFGQHFLKDPSVLERMTAALNPKPDDRLLEIGPGQGALTALLHGTSERFVAVEIDRDLIAMLKARFPELEVLNADVLRLPLEETLAGGDWRLIGNLPYNISSPLLIKLYGQLPLIRDMHFMFQRELAERLWASPGSKDWGRLSVVTQYHCSVEPLFDVPPDAFEPPPKVHSQVVRMLPRRDLPAVDERALDQVLKVAFSARRKRLGNALKSLVIDWDAVDVSLELRPDQVSLEDYLSLASALERED